MVQQLTAGALESIIGGESVDNPVLQVLSSKRISAQGSTADRYRLLLSDGETSYSHAMLATQLNSLMESGEMDNLAVVKVNRYLCNTIQGDKRVMILLDVSVLSKGSDVGQRLGNPQQLKAQQPTADKDGHHSAQLPPQMPKQESGGQSYMGVVSQKQNTTKQSPPANPYKAGNPNKGPGNYSMKGSNTPSTPGSSRVHTISSLTPYQNRWRIRARITQKGSVRTWSNSRGEGKLFSVNFTDESGEIRATGFNEAVDKFYDMLEMNKVYYVSRGTLKTANKQYSNVQNDYEMTFNQDTVIEPCTEEVDLPGINFQFVGLNELDSKAANSLVDVIGVVKTCGDVGTVTGRQSQKEITKRDISLVDQTGMSVNMTLWGNEATNFNGDGNPVMAVKGARLSDYGGRSLSVLASSQVLMNPTDLKIAFQLRSWFDSEGQNMDFQSFRGEGGGGSGSGTNWMTFADVRSQNIGGGEKADYFTSKGTLIFLRKENCMYRACPTESCNKKLIDQGNGMFRCEKCSREFPNFKWRMILSANIADFSDNQWVTCFQESAEVLLGKNAQELGDMKDSDEAAFDQVFQDAMFKSYIFKLRAKMETYNDETRLKTICVNANTVNWKEYGHRLVEEINKIAQ